METPEKKNPSIQKPVVDPKKETPKTTPQKEVDAKVHEKEVKLAEQAALREANAKEKAADAEEKSGEDTMQQHHHPLVKQVYDSEVQNPHAAL